FVAQSHTPCNRCVRFATTVASGHATLATKRTLLLNLGRTSTGWIAPACGWRTHSITSSAEASSCADSIPRAVDVVRLVTGAPPLLFCSGDERVHDMPREPQQPCMISRRNASLHLRLQNLPPHERCVTMPNGPPQ